MTSRWVVGFGVLAACAGCAAIVGLSDPSEAPDAAAQPDTGASGTNDGAKPEIGSVTNIGYGTGRDGELAITDRRSVNAYAPLAKNADAGARRISLRRTANTTISPVKAGDVLLVVQSASPGPKPDAGVSPLEAEAIGAWELVYVTSLEGDDVEISVPLAHAFTVPGAQAIVVPQYEKLEIGPNGVVAGQRWDGVSGGIVAILATEAVILNGSLDANNIGYRGGRAVPVASQTGCSQIEGLVDAGFAPRGEGWGSGDAGYGGLTGGRGNYGNGGGGGDCLNAGGAGGGLGGRGGAGGNSQDNARQVGGMPGAAIALSPGFARLRFGGGGGAGETNGSNNGSGGSGGGVIFVRAPKISGTGQIVARGERGGNAPADGAGGGGAGGTVYLDVAEAPVCSRIGITGGSGGSTDAGIGPGGGGGGGVVHLRADYAKGDAGPCPIESLAGVAGSDGTAPRGAAPSEAQRSEPPFVGVVSSDLAP